MSATVEILIRTPGGPAAGLAGGAPDAGSVPSGTSSDVLGGKGSEKPPNETKKWYTKIGGMLKGVKGFVKNNLGLQFGVASLLKQSQVFTSFIGVIFQLMGALIDVILAPFIPLIYPMARIVMLAIPYFQKWSADAARAFFKWSDEVYKKASDMYVWLDKHIGDFVNAWGKGGWSEVVNLLGEKGKDLLAWGWDKLISVGLPWIWEQAKNFFTSESSRFIGWFVQAFIMLGWFRNFSKWLGVQFTKVLTHGPMIILRILGKFGAGLLKMFIPGIGHLIVGLIKGILKIVPLILKGIMGVVNWIFKSAIPHVLKRLRVAFIKIFKESFGHFIKRIGKALTDVPIFGKAFKALAQMGPGIKLAAKGSKAIPVLGAVATLGFGIAETINNTKKYGLAAGMATAGKTALATGLAAGGQTWASLGVDLGGSLLINKMAKEGMFGVDSFHKQYTQEVNLNTTNIIKTADGRTLQEEVIVTQLDNTTSESDVSKLLSANQV